MTNQKPDTIDAEIDAQMFENNSLKNILHNLAWNGTYTDAGQTVINDLAVKEAEEKVQALLLRERKAELEKLLCPISCHYGDSCKIEHTRIKKSYVKDRIAELSRLSGENNTNGDKEK